MKYLKTLDFVGQSFILAAYVIGSAWLTIAEQKFSSLGLTTAYAMLCIGWWQMISAFLMLVLKAPNKKQRLIHFLAAVFYLLVLGVGAKYSKPLGMESITQFFSGLIVTVMIAIPAILAIFYYTITWRWMFPAKSTGKFLPHISF